MKTKILFTLDALYNGGTETSLLELASRFEAIDPVFCTFYEHRHLADDFQRAGLREHALKQHVPYGFGAATRFCREVVEAEQPQLVVGHLLRAELVTRWVGLRTGVPVVGTFVNDSYSAEAYATYSQTRRAKAEVFRLLNRVSARWCAHFIANSAAIGRSNARALGIPAERISVIPRGRDENVYHPPKAGRRDEIRVILSVARLLEIKGLRELIQAFARLASAFPLLELQIAGEGPFRTRLEHEIAHHKLEGRVRLLGNVRDVPSRLRDADLFVLPSHYEGFSGALVEAMLSGLPIVASDIPMNLEAVEDGHTARVFEMRDVGGLASQLQWCVEHPGAAVEMGRAAREVAVERFAIDRVALAYEALLLELAERFDRSEAHRVAVIASEVR